jgi:hypothetical protein
MYLFWGVPRISAPGDGVAHVRQRKRAGSTATIAHADVQMRNSIARHAHHHASRIVRHAYCAPALQQQHA